MFTGIIETIGKVEKIQKEEGNVHFYILSLFANNLALGQSISHDGVCLTVDEFDEHLFRVTAVQETLNRTNLGMWQVGTEVNLERCMPANGRFDGHIVQGHIDTTAVCVEINIMNGSHEFCFEYKDSNYITVEKGSITVNGVSLTVVKSEAHLFSVVVIPHTYQFTNFKSIKHGDSVNIEFDILGKYIQKVLKSKV